ncbi:MAG: hypothetical protein H6933_02490 [Burkholderiaceae bacterium]|nr:hypothetical protein [Burkholderiaceae bacterium]
MNRYNCIPLIAAALAGCASPQYLPPSSGPTASLRLVKHPTMETIAFVYKDSKDCRDRYELMGIRDTTDKVIKVAANTLVTASVMMPEAHLNLRLVGSPAVLIGTSKCQTISTFFAEEGGHYIVRTTVEPNECVQRVSRLVDGLEIPVEAKARQFSRAWTEQGSWCEVQP